MTQLWKKVVPETARCDPSTPELHVILSLVVASHSFGIPQCSGVSWWDISWQLTSSLYRQHWPNRNIFWCVLRDELWCHDCSTPRSLALKFAPVENPPWFLQDKVPGSRWEMFILFIYFLNWLIDSTMEERRNFGMLMLFLMGNFIQDGAFRSFPL